MDTSHNSLLAGSTTPEKAPPPVPPTAELQAQAALSSTTATTDTSTTTTTTPTQPPKLTTPAQFWTPSGYPIVDNKYLDLSTGQLRPHRPGIDLLRAGPPTVSVYWQNRLSTGRGGQFFVIAGSAPHARDVTDYLVRVGAFLRRGVCKVSSLNATRYDVFVVCSTDLSQEGFCAVLREEGLL